MIARVVLATCTGTAGLVALVWWWNRIPLRAGGHGSVHASRVRAGRVGGALAAGLCGGLVTGWPVGAVLAAAAAVGLPPLWDTRSVARATARQEAIATWTEMLRDALHASVGLSQAVVVTAPLAPPAIRPAVRALAARLRAGVAMDTALRVLASDVADPTIDAVVCALLLAASARAQRLGEVLGALAAATRSEVAMRMRVEAMRASARSSVRLVAAFSVAFFAVLAVFAHSYLAPFGTATGQLLLAVIGVCDAAGLWLLSRMVAGRPEPRLLGDAQGISR